MEKKEAYTEEEVLDKEFKKRKLNNLIGELQIKEYERGEIWDNILIPWVLFPPSLIIPITYKVFRIVILNRKIRKLKDQIETLIIQLGDDY